MQIVLDGVRKPSPLFLANELVRVDGEGRHLVIRHPELGLRRVPIRYLSEVWLQDAAQIGTSALVVLLSSAVPLHLVGRYGEFLGSLSAPLRGNLAVRSGQYALREDSVSAARIRKGWCLQRVRSFRQVEGMVRAYPLAMGAMGTLKLRLKSAESQLSTEAPLSAAELMGVEARTTVAYYEVLRHALNRLSFGKRSRQPAADEGNALMNYAYAVVMRELATCCHAVGLDLEAGFLHADQSGRESLLLDLLDLIRSPLVDRFLVALLRRGAVHRGSFELEEGQWRLTSDGRQEFFASYEQWLNRGESEGAWGRMRELAECAAKGFTSRDLIKLETLQVQPL